MTKCRNNNKNQIFNYMKINDKKIKIKTIKNSKGNIIKFFNFKLRLLNKYGEIYFSEVKK